MTNAHFGRFLKFRINQFCFVLFCFLSAAAEPWPENAALYQPLKGEGLNFAAINSGFTKYTAL